MRTWLRTLWTTFRGRRYQRHLQHDQVVELRRQDEIGHAEAGIHYPRGGGMGMGS